MSFLNPVNEPVLRFSSTDANAPQINYATRVAGDIKTIFKACLVTGYGTKTSAGWAITKDTTNIAEFSSPAAAMSDYKLGIDDRSATQSTWYYMNKTVRVNPANNIPLKSFASIDNAHASNGWQLLVTNRGLCFIEIVHNNSVSDVMCRLTYFGQVKSALKSNIGQNIGFWVLGCNSPISLTTPFFDPNDTVSKFFRVGSYSSFKFTGANAPLLAATNKTYGVSSVDTTAAIYLTSDNQFIVAEQPAILFKDVNEISSLYGVSDTTLNSRNVLKICLGADIPDASVVGIYARVGLIHLDYWEY